VFGYLISRNFVKIAAGAPSEEEAAWWIQQLVNSF